MTCAGNTAGKLSKEERDKVILLHIQYNPNDG
jgi:hypothetical protein